MSKDPHAQAEKLYQQLLDILEEMNAIYSDDSEEEEDDDDAKPIDLDDMIDGLVEDAVERGLDEESVERVLKSVAAFAKKVEEQ
jgi:hypothetical protein